MREPRYKALNTCRECRRHSAHCTDGTACAPARAPLRKYTGIRPTSDGFDCALPISIDSHSVCSFGCLYCFADNLIEHREAAARPIGQTSLHRVASLFNGGGGKELASYRPCPVQLGALTDPLDNIERQQGWFLEFAKIAIRYKQPVRISTKGNLFLEDEYLRAVAARPELFQVMFSTISPDEERLAAVDRRAPSCKDRIESMRRLNAAGVKAWLRFRPIIPGISDSTPSHPDAWRELIQMAHDAGARRISYEVAFLPGRMTKEIRARWRTIEKVSGLPLIQIYRAFGRNQACTRPSYKWTEQIMHAIHAEAHRLGMTVGVSDPVWKQLTDVGCCCGIPEDDPVFGNWQRESCTNQLLLARRDGKRICSKDIIPAWAYKKDLHNILAPGVGPSAAWEHRHGTWAKKLREVWLNLRGERNPLAYFQGALVPEERLPDGDIAFSYRGLPRTDPTATPHWKVV